MLPWSVPGTKRAQFQMRSEFLGTSELVPLGGAYAKSCTKMWDGAPSDLWEYTGSDEDADGLPDWWEAYAKAQGYYTGDDLSWDTEVTYNGRKMPAATAYQIDIYKGVMPVNGVAKLDPAYQSSVDTDGDLIPDWWEKLYDVEEYGALDDPDGDGLCNYVEFLLSVAFDVGAKFDPLNAYSASRTEPDYFFPIGSVYAGELFTDHDMMDDRLEDSWGAAFASRLAWDGQKDADEDGWSNFAEASYHDFTARIIANYASHIVGDAEIKDMPIPTLKLTLRYNGSQPLTGTGGQQGGAQGGGQGGQGGNEDANTLAPLVVQTFTRAPYVVPDATFNVQPGEATANTVYLGAWAERTVGGTLTPGYVNPGTFKIEYAEVDRNDAYTFQINDLTPLSPEYAAAYPAGLYRGTYEDYMGALGMFGPDYVELQSSDFAWASFQDPAAITVTQDESGEDGYICRMGERIGHINLMTGQFSLDMGPLADLAVVATNATGGTFSMAQSVLRITYDSVVPKLQSNKLNLYLGEPQTGYVKEGPNVIVAFYDLDGDGKYTAGEPMGCAMDVDVDGNVRPQGALRRGRRRLLRPRRGPALGRQVPAPARRAHARQRRGHQPARRLQPRARRPLGRDGPARVLQRGGRAPERRARPRLVVPLRRGGEQLGGEVGGHRPDGDHLPHRARQRHDRHGRDEQPLRHRDDAPLRRGDAAHAPDRAQPGQCGRRRPRRAADVQVVDGRLQLLHGVPAADPVRLDGRLGLRRAARAVGRPERRLHVHGRRLRGRHDLGHAREQ